MVLFSSVFESALFAVVLVYSLLFLVWPSPGLLRASRPKASADRAIGRALQQPGAARQKLEPLEGVAQVPAEALHAPQALVRHTEEEIKPHAAASGRAEPNWMDRLRSGLQKTRTQLFKGLDELFLSKEVKIKRDEVLETVFELLIRSDVGVKTTERLVEAARRKLAASELADLAETKKVLADEMLAVFQQAGAQASAVASGSGLQQPHVVLVVGVNGVGKTTTTGKLAKRLSDKGAHVVVGAADTFRAAAVEQLKVWAERAHAEFVTFKEGSDPAAVAFEAVKRSVEIHAELKQTQPIESGAQPATEQSVVCLVDTAGRLHNRKDLMEELSKVKRVVAKVGACAVAPPHEVILVVDATTGQNAIAQARAFMEMVDVTGLILTKLDGTAKGGVALAIAGDLGLPILFVGVGESVEDLQPFDAREFVDALFA